MYRSVFIIKSENEQKLYDMLFEHGAETVISSCERTGRVTVEAVFHNGEIDYLKDAFDKTEFRIEIIEESK